MAQVQARSSNPHRTRAKLARRPRLVLIALVLGVVLLVASSCELPPVEDPGTPTETPTRPLVGVLGATGSHYAKETKSGIEVVTIAASWASAQPTAGTFSANYSTQLTTRIAAARSAGMQVILDPGIQYTPAWVFDLPGGTRFVNQYGDVFSGAAASGDNVANAVTNSAVRSALGRYLDWLGTQIPAGQLWGIRQGGGPLGETRYPNGSHNGHTNSFWAYDASTQAVSPVPGWVPGTGTTAQAQQFLDSYNGALNVYARWLNQRLFDNFGVRVLLLLPGWGQRPGVAAKEVASLLTRNADEFNEGLDWADLLSSLPRASHTIAYTTYLDAPSHKATTELEDPPHYIAELAAANHLRLGGENTGTATAAAMQLSLERADELGYSVVNWMNEARLVNATSGQPTFDMLKNKAAAILG